VETINPPMAMIASGDSRSSPMAHSAAIGIMPTDVPTAVIRMGRVRTRTAPTRASMVESPRSRADAMRDRRLRRLLMRHLAMVRDNAALPRIVFSDDAYAGRPARRARMFAGIRTHLDDVAAIVQQGQADGQIRPDVDPQTVATLFLGLIQPGAILWHMSDGAFDVTRHAERGWRLLSDMLRTTMPPVPPRPRSARQH
jgi:hypothetical protein